jgi:N-acetylneuraminic acid mutarotase
LFVAVFTGCSSSEVDRGTTWQALPTNNAPRAQRSFAHAWTGSELLVWGGDTTPLEQQAWDHALATGAGFDPDKNRWTPMSTVGAPSGRSRPAFAWTGSELVVWGGADRLDGDLGDGARYDPVLDRWTPMSSLGAPTPRRDAIAVWTGNELVVLGGHLLIGPQSYAIQIDDGGLYNPASDSWRPLAAAHAPDGQLVRMAEGALATWTGHELVLWGASFDPAGQQGYDAGWIFDPVANTWRMMSASGEPSTRSPAILSGYGDKTLMWGGDEFFESDLDGALYDVATDSWQHLPSADALPYRRALLAGDHVIVSSADNDPQGRIVNPLTGMTESLPALAGTSLWTPLAWTGNDVLVWLSDADPVGQVGGRFELPR